MSLRSPLGRVLGLGSAKDGTEHWWTQRLTAVALVPLGLWFAIALAAMGDFSHAAVSAWIAQPLNTVLLLLLVLASVYHSHLGVQVVVEDYVEGPLKVASLMLLSLVHALIAVAGAVAILRVAFGVAS